MVHVADMVHVANVACETRADATGTQGHVAEPREPCVRYRWRTGRGDVVGGQNGPRKCL